MVRVVWLLLLVVAGAAAASETGLTGEQGHPPSRFPLAVHAAALGRPPLDAAVRRAVADWNALFQDAFGRPAFAWSERAGEAAVTIAFAPQEGPRVMGETHVRSDQPGAIVLPVRIVVYELGGRGRTPAEAVLYQVLAHELGHALGLGHVSDPRSLMCCTAGRVDFDDPATRAAYLEARRHPDLRSVAAQLTAHYQRFWQAPAPAR